jgi:hypothetical protein
LMYTGESSINKKGIVVSHGNYIETERDEWSNTWQQRNREEGALEHNLIVKSSIVDILLKCYSWPQTLGLLTVCDYLISTLFQGCCIFTIFVDTFF